jgi:hypothetical protein
MRVCGQHFSPDTIADIKASVDADPALTRCALSRRVCEWLEWRAPNRKLQEVSCRKALLQLHRDGIIPLPAADRSRFVRSGARRSVDMPDVVEVSCSLEELGGVELVPVSSRYSAASRVWNDLMDTFHYLGSGPLCGAQIRYLIRSTEYGYVGGLAFSSAVWALKSREKFIGWTEGARRSNLRQVVCNSRFLIAPSVNVPNLASHVLKLCACRLGADWLERYGYEPVLLETFVDKSRFRGTCYQAANWTCIGQTAARATAFSNGKVADGPKDIYVYALRRDWKSVLCAEPQLPLGSTPRPVDPADWTEEEFGAVQFFDERLKQRLYTLAADFFAQPGELIPQVCGGARAKIKAAYRFFSNDRVDMQTLLRPHIETTIERIRPQPVVLAAQDTSTLVYTPHPPEGVGPINTTKDKAVGLLLHDTMAFTPEGTPLGLLDIQVWARDPRRNRKKDQRKELPIEQKESMKWLTSFRAVAEAQALCPDTMLVSVGDREADIYELFHEAYQDPDGPKVLIRAERTRNRQVEQEHLWAKMAAEPLAGMQEVDVPAKTGRPARVAKLQVRVAQVRLSPPKNSTLPAVEVWAVYAREVDYGPQVKKPIDWMLLTTVPTTDFEAACERLRWYSRRWGIEVYHRTLKSGCRIQDRRLDDTQSLKACLAIDLVVAWRVYWLTMAGRETPGVPCDRFLEEEEWRVLAAWATNVLPPSEPPPIQEVTRWIGKLGGWFPRSKDDNPGTTCMWRGLLRLPSMVAGYLLALQQYGIRAGP